MPIVFGPLGIVFGIIAIVRGSRGLGAAAVAVSVLGLIVGLVLGALLLAAFGGQLPQPNR